MGENEVIGKLIDRIKPVQQRHIVEDESGISTERHSIPLNQRPVLLTVAAHRAEADLSVYEVVLLIVVINILARVKPAFIRLFAELPSNILSTGWLNPERGRGIDYDKALGGLLPTDGYVDLIAEIHNLRF